MSTRKQILDQDNNEILPITDTEAVRNPQSVGGTLESRLQNIEEDVENNDLLVEQSSLTDQQRNTALANVCNQTANSTTGKMGYKVLDPTKTFAEQVTAENTIYEIRDVFDLGGSEFVIPNGVQFNFNGGVIKNGVLNGELNTIQPLKGSNIGLKYGYTVYTDGASNLNKFKILSGLTNKVTVYLEDDLYLNSASERAFVGDYISIDGCGHTISNYGTTDCFNVNKDVELFNVNVVSNGSRISLFQILDDNSVSNIHIKNCKFSGNVRIITNNKLANQELTKYFDTILIESCEFNNIWYNGGSVVIFFFSDSNLKNAIIKDNKVHNFYGELFGFGLTNSSVYETYVRNFADTMGRNFTIENNHIENDITFKPWVVYENLAPAYDCFTLIEYGNCVCRNNHFENIISNNSSIATYDNYFSVDNLLYENNFWKNNVNLTGAYNEFLKGKGGSTNGERVYRGNKFVTTDISSNFTEIEETPLIRVLDLQSNTKKKLVIDNNEFSIFKLYGNPNLINKINYVYIKNNVINVTNVTNSQQGYFIDSYSGNEYTEITGNYYNVSNIGSEGGSAYKSPSLVYSSSTKNIIVKNNITINSIPIEQTVNCQSCIVSDNYITCNSNFSGSSIVNAIKEGFSFRNNIIKNSNANLKSVTYQKTPCEYSFIYSFTGASGTIQIFDELEPTKISNCIIKITDLTDGKYQLNEFNYTKESNVNVFKYIDTNGVYVSGSSLSTNYNLGNKAIGTFSSKVLYEGTLPNKYLFEVSVKHIDSIDKFTHILSKGTTTQRPTGITIPTGFQYYDTTLGKYICWNRTDWVNLDGTALS